MVFAQNTENLQDAYDNFFASKIVSKYPHLLKYFEGLRSRKSEWALALRKHLMLRGNNTKNISEAGIRILKEIIFQRVQAFNLVQIFDFITITLEMLFEQRLLATAYLRRDSHIALQFKGMGISKLPPAFITTVEPKKRSLCSEEHLKEKMSYCWHKPRCLWMFNRHTRKAVQTPSCYHKEIAIACKKYGPFNINNWETVLCSVSTGGTQHSANIILCKSPSKSHWGWGRQEWYCLWWKGLLLRQISNWTWRLRKFTLYW